MVSGLGPTSVGVPVVVMLVSVLIVDDVLVMLVSVAVVPVVSVVVLLVFVSFLQLRRRRRTRRMIASFMIDSPVEVVRGP
jgi:Flp pilus assembly protein TadB